MNRGSEDWSISQEEMVELSGDTYTVRDRLKELGGVFDFKTKTWSVPESKKMLAEYYINNSRLEEDEDLHIGLYDLGN